MARTRQPYQDIWGTMKANADIASVRPAPLSNIRSAPGNVRYGSLTESVTKEVTPAYDRWTGSSPMLNPAPAKEAAPRSPAIARPPPIPAAEQDIGPLWMGKGDGSSSASVLAPDLDAVARLRQSGYEALDQTEAEVISELSPATVNLYRGAQARERIRSIFAEVEPKPLLGDETQLLGLWGDLVARTNGARKNRGLSPLLTSGARL